MKDVRISAVLNGWIAKVGCQTLVFTDRATLLKELDLYMADPAATERAYLENAVNAKHLRDVNEVESTNDPFDHAGQDGPESWER